MPISTTTTTPNFVDLPGPKPARIDANVIVCVRVEETTDEGSFVMVQTSQGFSFWLSPYPDQSIKKFYNEILASIWPERRADG